MHVYKICRSIATDINVLFFFSCMLQDQGIPTFPSQQKKSNLLLKKRKNSRLRGMYLVCRPRALSIEETEAVASSYFFALYNLNGL